MAQMQNARLDDIWSPLDIEASLSGVHLAINYDDRRILSQWISDDSKLRLSPWFEHLDMLRPTTLLKCRVTNSGNEPAHQAVLDLPAAPAIVMLGGKALPAATASRTIEIGEIRPGVATDVLAWFHGTPGWLESDYHVSYQNGSGKVSVLSLDYVFPGKASRFVMIIERWPSMFAFIGILVILGVVLILDGIMKARARTQKDDESQGGGT
jgi:hypothetical protein